MASRLHGLVDRAQDEQLVLLRDLVPPPMLRDQHHGRKQTSLMTPTLPNSWRVRSASRVLHPRRAPAVAGIADVRRNAGSSAIDGEEAQ